eukprot:1049033_1
MVIMKCSEGRRIYGKVLLGRDSYGGLGRYFVFPALASALPAIICGFIANFVWEEKFIIKCSDDTQNTHDLCFDDERGCCGVVSSHELQFMYAFIGSLSSNILATWAIIRILGYIIVNASPSLSMYIKRRK